MTYYIVHSEIFKNWWYSLDISEKESVTTVIELLEIHGITLGFPFSSKINEPNLKTKHMRELRIQHKGSPYRILYAFDPKQQAVLLLGGDKSGNKRWYKKNVPLADKIYQEYLKYLKGEIK
jgi:hypothetical protein